MARKWYYDEADITCPAGTAQASPQSTTVSFGDVWLESIRWRIPPGWQGLAGFYVQGSGQVVVPWASSPTFIVGDDEYDTVDVGVEVNANQLVVVMFNSDTLNPHTVYLRIKYMPIAAYTAGQAAPAPLAPIAGVTPTPTPSPSPAPTPSPGGTPAPSPSPMPTPSPTPTPTPTPMPPLTGGPIPEADDMAVVITPHPGGKYRNIAVCTQSGTWYPVPDEPSQAWLEHYGAELAPGVPHALAPPPATIPATLLAVMRQAGT